MKRHAALRTARCSIDASVSRSAASAGEADVMVVSVDAAVRARASARPGCLLLVRWIAAALRARRLVRRRHVAWYVRYAWYARRQPVRTVSVPPRDDARVDQRACLVRRI